LSVDCAEVDHGTIENPEDDESNPPALAPSGDVSLQLNPDITQWSGFIFTFRSIHLYGQGSNRSSKICLLITQL